MCLLPGTAEDVDSKDSRMTDLFISRKKLHFLGQKEKWSMLCHVKANQHFAKNRSKTKNFLSPGIVFVVNEFSYGKLC